MSQTVSLPLLRSCRRLNTSISNVVGRHRFVPDGAVAGDPRPARGHAWQAPHDVFDGDPRRRLLDRGGRSDILILVIARALQGLRRGGAASP